MPEDMKFPFEYDETGDVATVDGDEFYYRHALQLALIATEDVKGEGLTATDVVAIEDRIATMLASSPYIEPPIVVDTLESQTTEYRAEVTVGNFDNSFEITA